MENEKPGEKPGAYGRRTLSRSSPTTTARKGSLALGVEADYSGGTAADLHGLSHFPSLLDFPSSLRSTMKRVNQTAIAADRIFIPFMAIVAKSVKSFSICYHLIDVC